MRILPSLLPPLALAGLFTVPPAATAAELGVTLEIPRLAVAEYHRPYVAIWVERPDGQAVTTLAVWYEVAKRNNEGETWLKDMRQWWRRAGRDLRMPVDGVSGATRAPGRHTVAFDAEAPFLRELPAGQYNLAIEAAREVGGRELLRVPFQWPPAALEAGSAQGASELGAVSVQARP